MKKILLTAIATCCLSGVQAQGTKPAIPQDPAIEKKVEQWIDKMTLDEKIGQMLELGIDCFGKMEVVNPKLDRSKMRNKLLEAGFKSDEITKLMRMKDADVIKALEKYNLDIYAGDTKMEWKLNEHTLDTIIRKYKIGSILNAPATRAQTVDTWQDIIQTIQKKSMKHIGIPCIYGLDNNHGVTYIQSGTIFPQPINMAASFNTALAKTGAEITAYESRAANCPWVYNPTIDLGRDPRWPRIWESFGEDANVNARMVEAMIAGYQGDDPNHLGKYNVGTSVKHYFAYGAPFTGKDRTPAIVSPSMLREKYFEPFKRAIQAGALTIMVNSASDRKSVV